MTLQTATPEQGSTFNTQPKRTHRTFEDVQVLSNVLSRIQQAQNVFIMSFSAARALVDRVVSGESRRAVIVAPTYLQAKTLAHEIIAASPGDCFPIYRIGHRRLSFPNGSEVDLTGADMAWTDLRGPNYDTAWVHAVHQWDNKDAWDMLYMCLRLGLNPRMIISTQ